MSSGRAPGRTIRGGCLTFESRCARVINLMPEDVYRGRGREIRTARERLKEQALRRRRRVNRGLPVNNEDRILPSLYLVAGVRLEALQKNLAPQEAFTLGRGVCLPVAA